MSIVDNLLKPFRDKGRDKKRSRRSLNKRNAERAGAKGDYTFIEGLGNSHGRIRIPYHPVTKEPILSWERQELIQMGRYLYANDGIVKGAIDDLARYSLPLSPQANTKNAKWNQQAEAYFRRWSETADIKKRISFEEIQKLASICLDRDGDIGVLHVAEKTGGHCIQLIESDRIIDHPEGKEEYSQGVLLDRYGRPLSYCIREETKKGFRIVRSDLMQLFLEPERADQIRGISSISHAVAHIRDKKDILSFEKQGVKNISSFAAVLESEYDLPDDDAFGLTEDEVPDGEGGTTEITVSQMQSGSVPVLRKGEKIQTIDHNRPSSAFQGFLEFLVREFAIGIGLPYEFIWNTQGLTGPSQRFVMGKAQRRFEERQRLFIPFVKRSWLLVIGDAIARGLLPSAPDGWEDCKVQTPAKITIDVGREAQQDREDVSAGLMSLQDHFGQRGLDWQNEITQQANELSTLISIAKTVSEEHGVDLSLVLNRLGAPEAVRTEEIEQETKELQEEQTNA